MNASRQMSALPQASYATIFPAFALHPVYLKARRKRPAVRRPKLQENYGGAPALPYPKPSPTPLLVPHISTSVTANEALDRLLADLQSTLARGVRVDSSTFCALLELLFRNNPSPSRAIAIHRLIPASLLRSSAGISYKLLRLYASCGLVEDAHRMFDEMPRSQKNSAFPWNALISGYADLGHHVDAMALYYEMMEEDVEPDCHTFPRVIKACAGVGSLPHALAIHRDLVRSGFASDLFVLNALVSLYAKCGDITHARRIFDQIPDRDPIAYNSMLNGYIRHGLFPEAIDICRRMLMDGLEPDSVTLSSLLAGCASSKCHLGLEIHGWILRHRFEPDVSVANSLITFYAEYGNLARALLIFNAISQKDLVSWNAIISANRRSKHVLNLFRFIEDSRTAPDAVMFVSLLSACANLGLVEEGRKLFNEMEDLYGIKPAMEHYGCMVNLLGRAGQVEEAFELVTRKMPFEGGSAIWGALLYACSVHGKVNIGEAVAGRLFELEPDNEHNFELLRKIYRVAGRVEGAARVEKLASDRGLVLRSVL